MGRRQRGPATLTDSPAPGSVQKDPGSFRDPSGFIYRSGGTLYRQVNASFGARWDDLQASGLLERLQQRGALIRHDLVDDPTVAADPGTAHRILRPEPIELISYPYEWSFGELKDAALLTLTVQEEAVAAGFRLRDASAYNIQFHRGRPILVDTLSFERSQPGTAWAAYRQFCEHFVTPLALMAHRDVRCGLMLREHTDGIPLDLAARLLPARTRYNLGLGSHIHIHARAQRRYASAGRLADPPKPRRMTTLQQAALLDGLRRTIDGLRWDPTGTEWADYAENTSYDDHAAGRKDWLVERLLNAAGGHVVWDLGANTGRFSRIAAALGRRVVAWDADPAATERHYRQVRADDSVSILPLVVDLANPSPRLGWAHEERRSFIDRANADVVLALALVHHLAIGRNIPLDRLAEFFAGLAPALIVEFVPKIDPMVTAMLATREDVFPDYTLEGFRSAFGRRFALDSMSAIDGSDRVLLRMSRRA